uniref:Uncharacterized protein n=1 Tax=Hyaloperonospora arabidopsidis (strain Emoy2) TaxID=559515 RepID=M4C008_HYAAE
MATIPFRGALYRVSNMHPPVKGSVWARQLDTGGIRLAAQREYVVELHNVTRFTDVSRLTAYFEAHIAAGVELDDMDTCTPNSLTSTVWKLTVKLAGCPDFLCGVVRLIWYGSTIILKHPEVGNRLQCLHCGDVGHPMARCRYDADQIRGPGSRVATEQEVAGLEDLAVPFGSMAEVKQMASLRLQPKLKMISRLRLRWHRIRLL